MDDNVQWRVGLDAEVTFGNGGDLRVRDFRLDIPRADIDDDELADLFIRHLGLLMVDKVHISGKRRIREPHKGSRRTTEEGAWHAPKGASGVRAIDLSHPIRDGMITYPGLPGPVIGEHLTRQDSRAGYAPGTEFSIGRISMVANTGTYVDSPFHRFAEGVDLAALPLDRLTDLDGVVVRVTGASARAIDRPALLPHDVAGRAVLIHTGWDRHFGTERYGVGHPYLTRDAAAWLAEQGAALVGIDSVNIDDTADGTRPAHTTLLAAGVPIVEHLRGLDALPPSGFRFHAVPPPVVGMGSFPVRAYALCGPADGEA
ncbi:cyclase family protein [Thermopolyspora sp. NPDC052614]|uniref:cyclase family protein n=1 Tax=Thermopolyspora sp. NPDC052614 TaxID=3155682 RepID=UPI0034198BF5